MNSKGICSIVDYFDPQDQSQWCSSQARLGPSRTAKQTHLTTGTAPQALPTGFALQTLIITSHLFAVQVQRRTSFKECWAKVIITLLVIIILIPEHWLSVRGYLVGDFGQLHFFLAFFMVLLPFLASFLAFLASLMVNTFPSASTGGAPYSSSRRALTSHGPTYRTGPSNSHKFVISEP